MLYEDDVQTTATTKRAGWKNAMTLAVGAGVIAAVLLGIGFAFAITETIRAGLGVGSAAIAVALVAAYLRWLRD